MTRLTLPKRSRLCSRTAVEMMFAPGGDSRGKIAYPLRGVWRENPGRPGGDRVQFMVTIPKKRLRRAVDRVLMRRRVREAYRLNRHRFEAPEGPKIDIAILYLADETLPYATIERAVCRLLEKIHRPAPPAKPVEPSHEQ